MVCPLPVRYLFQYQMMLIVDAETGIAVDNVQFLCAKVVRQSQKPRYKVAGLRWAMYLIII